MNDLKKGIFTISLDFELIWGTFDLFGTDAFRAACELEREEVIDRLLALFNETGIPATWCIIGHLFLDSCRPDDGVKHPEITRPRHKWYPHDWFTEDPCGDEKSHPLFYGKSLIEKILASRVRQEIGSHSFSHVIFGDPGCSVETARSEIAECIRAAEKFDIKLDSFAFPRDKIGHLPVLREYGFTSYRGSIPNWYEQGESRNVVKRLAHLWDVLTASTPPVVLPEKEEGLWNIPGSMIFFPMHGVRRYVPKGLRAKRAIKGLDKAAAEKRIFHLWFHPTNMAFEPEIMFDELRQILEHASNLRERGSLEILSMSEIIKTLNEEN